MTNKMRVLEFLKADAPKTATNAEIRARTGIQPHQQVFQITQSLLKEKTISGSKIGREWHFRIK